MLSLLFQLSYITQKSTASYCLRCPLSPYTLFGKKEVF